MSLQMGRIVEYDEPHNNVRSCRCRRHFFPRAFVLQAGVFFVGPRRMADLFTLCLC
jgi:hypothetical protein